MTKLAACITRALGALAVAVIAAGTALPARAGEEAVHGIVLSVLGAEGEAVVRHDAFGGMPAMTMEFRVEPKSVLDGLQPGDRIEAQTDISADVPRLEDIRVVGNVNTVARAVHDVQPLGVGDQLPLTTTFFDQNGDGFSFQDFRGQTLLLGFIYTRCRDPRMCPLISSSYHVLQQKLAGLPVHLVEITLDPAYDTPEVLAAYGRRFGADATRWTLGTGPINVVNDFAARFGIAVFADPVAGLIHSEATAVVDGNGKIVDLIHEAAWSPDAVAAELESVAAVPANPIARLEYELSKDAQALCGNSLPGTSGLVTLAFVLVVFTGASYTLYRCARLIFVEEPADKA